MSGLCAHMDSCVCVQDFQRECDCRGREIDKSPEGGVCVSSHTLRYTTLVTLVSSVVCTKCVQISHSPYESVHSLCTHFWGGSDE